MTELLFRSATENDLDFIKRLSAVVFSIYGNYEEIIADWFLRPNVITAIVKEEPEPLGFAMLAFRSEGEPIPAIGELLAIAVIPEYQRLGIGGALLAHTQSLALQHDLKGILLHTAKDNISALSFFEKAGYKVIGSRTRYYPRGQPALAMYKTLIP